MVVVSVVAVAAVATAVPAGSQQPTGQHERRPIPGAVFMCGPFWMAPCYRPVVRYFTPILFVAVGGFVGWYNSSHPNRVILLPLLDRVFPSLEGDLISQGTLTCICFLVVGLALLIWQAYFHLQERRGSRVAGETPSRDG